jgi:hypothetical protein
MSTSAIELDATAVGVTVEAELLRVTLADGRELAVPLECFRDYVTPLLSSEGTGGLSGEGREFTGQMWMRIFSVAGLLRVN